uniref:Platelet endothelial aggregation receptor 1-like n=1 Tax=Pundamilia nyererei TaxID=303518 RepID=A0A3B4GMT9_9CICH
MPTLQSSAVLLLFSILIGLSCSLDPRDPNVCSTWESFTTSVKESYLHPYDQVGEEPCSDPRTSYKCMITYKTAYRQAVKTDYRKRYQCCPGYYESRGKCVPRCTKECVHGRCVAPDRCQCEGGWRGDDCSSGMNQPSSRLQTFPHSRLFSHLLLPFDLSDCDDKHWGANCKHQCKCENGALCDPVKGSCRCPPGFNGRYCEESCPAGTFGKKCQARCPCQNGGICKGKGICACPPGWTGPVCTERCPEGRFGPNCTEECVCHNNGKCDAETGQCQCAKGFTGHRCKEECAAGSYGQDCKGVCDCANGARCYNIDGACLCEPGFSGPHCRDRMCPDGIYGMHCERTCLCQDKHTLSCHPMKGECTCQPGWAGLYCNETCAHGFYGHGCLEPCLCVNGGVCDGATGRCHCAPGFTGLHCENPCKSGTYGKNCSLECSCKNYVDCSPIDGTCFCKEGWRGPDCSIPCSEGTWGPGCNATCHCANGAKCNPADGSCTCTAGWQGARCDQPCPMGTFGPGCLKRCDCVHADGCQATTGECHCLPGWSGPRCSEPCSEGLWGRHCNQTCFKHCPNSDTCLRETGACVCRPGYWGVTCQNSELARCVHCLISALLFPSECRTGTYGDQCSMRCQSCGQSYRCHHVTGECDCLPGYTGPNCDQVCPAGYFGKQCSEVCLPCANNSTCNHRNGHCECLPGWTAIDCSKHSFQQTGSVMSRLNPGERESWGAIAGIVVLVILVVLLLALLLLYRRRQKEKQNNTPTVSFSTSRTVNSEYAVPVGLGFNSQSCSILALHGLHMQLISQYLFPAELKDSAAVSSSSLNSENPYATIKDLPGLPLPFCPPESSYMEMKSAVPRERALFGPHSEFFSPSECQSSHGHAPHEDPQSHYDLPVNSHIPGHYDLPPVRRPPSPCPSPRRSPQ